MLDEMRHIRIVSPSGAIDPAYIDGACARLREWGFAVSEGRYARTKVGRFAGTDEERLADLCEALQDPSVNLVLCSRGGYGLQRIIDRVGTVTKPVIGFSDITCLHVLAFSQGMSSLHAPMCKHIATWAADSASLQLLHRTLCPDHTGDALAYKTAMHPLNRIGKVRSTLVGGNLSVLYGLQGTPYGLTALLEKQNGADKPVLFIEDIAERHYHIDRMMQNLRLSGVFDHIGGLVVGQFADCQDDPAMGCSVLQTIREAVENYDFPILFGFPTGHGDCNYPLWFGGRCILDVEPDGALLATALPRQEA